MIYIGIDIGSIGIKAAAVGSFEDRAVLENACRSNDEFFFVDGGIDGKPILLSKYQRILGQPARMMQQILEKLLRRLPGGAVGGIRITGAGGQSLPRTRRR